MEITRQNQSAGDNSQQFQLGNVTNLTIVRGITEERAKEIYREMNRQTMALYAQDARDEALRRIGILERQVLRRSEDVEGLLEAFADPAFQILLAEAQKRAAATEREIDYNLLSELLVCHVQKGASRKNRAAIDRAVEIIDDIDTNALCALTVAYSFTNCFPSSGNISEGLGELNEFAVKIVYEDLPDGFEWLDHLDVLGAVRISLIGKIRKLDEYQKDMLEGYIRAGIQQNSEEHIKAVEILSAAGINLGVLVENDCLDGYVRLNIPNEKAIEELALYYGHVDSSPLEDRMDALKRVWGLYSKDSKANSQAQATFNKKWDSYNALAKVKQWWNQIPVYFQITSVGKVLAHINAKRCEPELPDLI